MREGWPLPRLQKEEKSRRFKPQTFHFHILSHVTKNQQKIWQTKTSHHQVHMWQASSILPGSTILKATSPSSWKTQSLSQSHARWWSKHIFSVNVQVHYVTSSIQFFTSRKLLIEKSDITFISLWSFLIMHYI